MFRCKSGLQASCSLCLRLNDLIWLRGHWNWRCVSLGSILVSNGRNARCIVCNFPVRRREMFDLELAAGSWCREFHTPVLSVKPLFNIYCHDMWTPRSQWSALYEKEQRAVAPALIFCNLWGEPMEKKLVGLIGTLFSATGSLYFLLLDDLCGSWERFFSVHASPKN